MYTKISKPLGRNSSSCKGLVEYLNKDQNTYFTNNEGRKVSDKTVSKNIDNNVKKLSKEDDKFYMITFSPSEYELRQLVGRDVDKFESLSKEEQIKLMKDLNAFTRKAMDKYAINFKRESITSGKDLMYFSRIETLRVNHHYDKDVRVGSAKVGELKKGMNVHIHVIVSRKSADGKVKLSPNMRFKNKTFDQGEKKITRGFDYNKFTSDCHDTFKQQFNIQYERNFDYTRDKFVSSSKVNSLVKGKLTSQVKGIAKNAITQGEFAIEQKMMSNTMQAINMVKTISKLSNPASSATELAKQALRIGQKLQQIAIQIIK